MTEPVILSLVAVGTLLVTIALISLGCRLDARRPDYHRIAMLESEVRVHIGHVVLMAEEEAEAEHRREIVTNALEDWVHGGSVIQRD